MPKKKNSNVRETITITYQYDGSTFSRVQENSDTNVAFWRIVSLVDAGAVITDIECRAHIKL